MHKPSVLLSATLLTVVVATVLALAYWFAPGLSLALILAPRDHAWIVVVFLALLSVAVMLLLFVSDKRRNKTSHFARVVLWMLVVAAVCFAAFFAYVYKAILDLLVQF